MRVGKLTQNSYFNLLLTVEFEKIDSIFCERNFYDIFLLNIFSLKAQLNADFSVNDTTVCFGQSITFIDASTGNPTSWKWYFGDGDSSFLQNPTHSYAFSGSVNVTLIVLDSVNSDTVNKIVSISILPPINLILFSAPEMICNGDPVQLNASASGGDGSYSFLWIEINGSFTSSNASPIVFPPGTYPTIVQYEITVDDGCSPIVKDTVKVSFYQNPSAAFFVNASYGCSPMTVTFTNASSAGTGLVSCLWDLGDNSPIINSCSSISHSYVSPGYYDVQLTITSSDGNNCNDKQTNINYIVVNPIPISNFSISPQSQIVLNPVNFSDLSSGNGSIIQNWKWNFGDWSNDSIQNPVHIYQDIGIFNVSLEVTTEWGCNDTSFQTVEIINDTLFVPNLITPNGDGFNDFFVIEGKNNCSISIFNVWNEEIYNSSNYKNDWNGTNKGGKLLDTGAYYYVLECGGQQTTGVINILH